MTATPTSFSQVLNIIAELKPPRRLETIEFLKGYGFHCIRYMERYNGFWSSDTSISISEDYRFNIHHPYAESNGIWGLSCDAEVPAEMDFEVCELRARQRLPARLPIVLCCRIIGLFERMLRSVFGGVEIAKASDNQRLREYSPLACSPRFQFRFIYVLSAPRNRIYSEKIRKKKPQLAQLALGLHRRLRRLLSISVSVVVFPRRRR